MRKLFGFIRNHANKCVSALVGVLGFSAFAEGASAPDLTAAVNALTTMKDAIVGQNGWITQAAPILALLLSGILVITLIWVSWKWVTRGTKKAG